MWLPLIILHSSIDSQFIAKLDVALQVQLAYLKLPTGGIKSTSQFR